MKLVNLFSKFHHDQIFGSISFKENPLFGIGAKNFKYTLIGWHPHNYHAQILSELGIFSYLTVFLTFFSYHSMYQKTFSII